jgi:hypothetical protein
MMGCGRTMNRIGGDAPPSYDSQAPSQSQQKRKLHPGLFLSARAVQPGLFTAWLFNFLEESETGTKVPYLVQYIKGEGSDC